MKRPTWVTVVGVLGIIFSVVSLRDAADNMVLGAVTKIQELWLSDMVVFAPDTTPDDETADDTGGRRMVIEVSPEAKETIDEAWDFPPWFGLWSILTGLALLILSGLYLFGSIAVLQRKPYAIRVFVSACCSLVILSVIKAGVALSVSSFMARVLLPGHGFTAVSGTVLLLVVAFADRKQFASGFSPPPTAGANGHITSR